MTGPDWPAPGRDAWRAGAVAGLPYALPSLVVAISFGALARDAGFPPEAAVAMSAAVFAGAGQFAALGVLASGGGLAAAVGAAGLVNSRFLPMGLALGPSLSGGRWRRAAEGQVVTDPSWALAARPNGRFDRSFLFGCSAVQYAAWVGGTAAGTALTGVDPAALGLDAVFPAFFLALLVGLARDAAGRAAAAGGAVIALALVGATPAGVPVLAASAAALVGLALPRQRRD